MLDAALQVLPFLLYLFWGLASLAAIAALLPCGAPDAFRSAVLLSACRGKLWEGRPTGALGPLTDCKVPQRWFSHFYDCGVAANTALLCFLFWRCAFTEEARRQMWWRGGSPPSAVTAYLPVCLLELHLVRRCWETRALLRYPPEASMHLMAYIFGVAYYLVLPLTCLPATTFRTSSSEICRARWENGALQKPGWLTVMATIVFLCGNLLQHDSHRLLARLSRPRSPSDAARDEPHYKIPRGGAFELVSCPHYLGEIVIYFGLALSMDVYRPLTWLPLVWVIANLSLAAGPTHAWYRQKFEDYPRHRRALVPFLY